MSKIPRIKMIKPRLATLKPLLAKSREESERQRFRDRDVSHEWRGWYGTAKWQALRERVLIRDLYTCQQTGVVLTGKYPAPNSPVVDHIKPHRGDYELFWDIDNLQTVAKSFHDQVKQSQERGPAR